jgi:hypothetical protein
MAKLLARTHKLGFQSQSDTENTVLLDSARRFPSYFQQQNYQDPNSLQEILKPFHRIYSHMVQTIDSDRDQDTVPPH